MIETENDEIPFESIFMSKDTLPLLIEKIVAEEGLNYFEAVIAFCEDNDKEIDEVISFMPRVLVDKVRQSACDMGLAAQGATLDL